jgi:hypothetical protein
LWTFQTVLPAQVNAFHSMPIALVFSIPESSSLSACVLETPCARIAANTHVAKLALLRTQASFDIPQTFAVGELCKCHAKILIEAGEAFDLVVAAIPLDAAPKRMHR